MILSPEAQEAFLLRISGQSSISAFKERLFAYLRAKRPVSIPRFTDHLSFRAWLWLFVPPPLRLLVYDVLRSFGVRLYGEYGSTQKLPLGLYIKQYNMMIKHWQLSEVHALLAVRTHTTITVPAVLDVLVLPYEGFPGDLCYIVMSEVPGEPLNRVITDGKLSPEDSIAIAADLKDCLLQLRSMPLRITPKVCSASGEPIVSLAFSDEYEPLPTFESVESFHVFLRERHPYPWRPVAWKLDPIFANKARSYGVTFTHGDLNPTNILVHNGRLSGLIDWEFAGYLPEYWDYAMSLWADRHDDIPIRTIMDAATVEDYTEEMEAFVIVARIWLRFPYDDLSFLRKRM